MTSLIDVGIRKLTLNGTIYELINVVGEGGSSIVYKARPEGKTDFCVIKEFYPHGCVEHRDEEGTIKFFTENITAVNNRIVRVNNEAEVAETLRHAEGNNDPWVLSYSMPYAYNNTFYTIVSTEAGDTLYERINKSYYEAKDFTGLCDCALQILDALEPIHNKGYLHLDISPDNIHCSELNIMRLIDFNSAYPVDCPYDELYASYKAGYSAPELKNNRLKLSYATDLFSVAAIFFTLLKRRPPESNDWLNPNRWFLDSDDGFLKGASALLVDKTNAFLQKNLSKTPSLRTQNIADMRSALEELVRLRQRIELVNSPKQPNAHFVCREKEIEAIDECLQKNRYVILEGIGGIGKTELAKMYAWENRNYDNVQFLTYTGDLQMTVAYNMSFHNINAERIAGYEKEYGTTAVKRIFTDKMRYLQQEHHDKRILLIIDNYNVLADDDFNEFVSGNYRVIFTSRVKHNGCTRLEISEMAEKDDLIMLFREYYKPLEITDEQELVVRDIIDLIQGHTMTIMLIATAMKEDGKTPQEILLRLRKGLDTQLPTSFSIEKEDVVHRESVMYEHIRALFDMTDIITNDRDIYTFIMTNMAVVPYAGMKRAQFFHWAIMHRYALNEYGDADYTDINWLIKRRWIQFDEQADVISLHPVISDIAYRELKPDSTICDKLIKAMLSSIKHFDEKTFLEQLEYAQLLELAYNRVTDETETTAKISFQYAHLNSALARYPTALESYKRYALIDKALGEDHSREVRVYYEIAGTYYDNEDYQEAMDYFQKAYNIGSLDAELELPNIAHIYNGMGLVRTQQGEYDMALELYGKAMCIYEKELGLEHESTATVYHNISMVHRVLRNYSKALEWSEKALLIREKVLGQDHQETALTYRCFALIYDKIGEYQKAVEMHRKAIAIHEKVFGKESHDTARGYYFIAVTLYHLERYSESLDWFGKALTVFEKVYGTKHHNTVRVNKCITKVQWKLLQH